MKLNTSCIDHSDIQSTKSVKILGITIDDSLRFDQHISDLCSKAAMQLNALGWVKKYMGKREKVAIVNSVIYVNLYGKKWKSCNFKLLFIQILTIVHWSGILVLVNRSEKWRKSKNLAWEVFGDNDSDYDVLLIKQWKQSD